MTTENGLPGNDVKAILEARDGSLWFGTYDGLAVLSPGFSRLSEQSRLKAESKTFTENEGLAGNHIRTIHEDASGTLWIGTYDGGLSCFAGGKFTNYTTENGLFSNGVFQILEDAAGNFWMSSNQGIYRVSRQQLNDFADGKRQTITSTVLANPTECSAPKQTVDDNRRESKRMMDGFGFQRRTARQLLTPKPSGLICNRRPS